MQVDLLGSDLEANYQLQGLRTWPHTAFDLDGMATVFSPGTQGHLVLPEGSAIKIFLH